MSNHRVTVRFAMARVIEVEASDADDAYRKALDIAEKDFDPGGVELIDSKLLWYPAYGEDSLDAFDEIEVLDSEGNVLKVVN